MVRAQCRVIAVVAEFAGNLSSSVRVCGGAVLGAVSLQGSIMCCLEGEAGGRWFWVVLTAGRCRSLVLKKPKAPRASEMSKPDRKTPFVLQCVSSALY